MNFSQKSDPHWELTKCIRPLHWRLGKKWPSSQNIRPPGPLPPINNERSLWWKRDPSKPESSIRKSRRAQPSTFLEMAYELVSYPVIFNQIWCEQLCLFDIQAYKNYNFKFTLGPSEIINVSSCLLIEDKVGKLSAILVFCDFKTRQKNTNAKVICYIGVLATDPPTHLSAFSFLRHYFVKYACKVFRMLHLSSTTFHIIWKGENLEKITLRGAELRLTLALLQ